MTTLEGILKSKAIENVVRRAVSEGWFQQQAVKDACCWLQRNEGGKRQQVADYVADQYAMNHLDSRGRHHDYAE